MSIFLSNLRLPVRELQFIISITGYPVLEDSPRDEGILEAWYSSGGIGRGENASQILQFDSGTLTNVALMMNHTGQYHESEIMEGCDKILLIQKQDIKNLAIFFSHKNIPVMRI